MPFSKRFPAFILRRMDNMKKCKAGVQDDEDWSAKAAA
jgi:hypothetical protein